MPAKYVRPTGNVTSREAVSLGLMVTELILNALKHAFPDNNKPTLFRRLLLRKRGPFGAA
jgi:two-component sensor histidine kinase